MADQSKRRFKDETGKVHDLLTVLHYEGKRKGQHFFACRCKCGEEVSVRGANLRSGNTTSCGCSRRKSVTKLCGRIQMKIICGVRVWGKVTDPTTNKTLCFTSCMLCRRVGYYSERKLRNRKALTCKCYRPTHNSWRKMIERCTNKNHDEYKYYGGCGITVCKSWRENFWAFFRDMGKRPHDKTLDRYPNRSGNYEPANCRWATDEQQALNRKPRQKKGASTSSRDI